MRVDGRPQRETVLNAAGSAAALAGLAAGAPFGLAAACLGYGLGLAAIALPAAFARLSATPTRLIPIKGA